jgi:hypothetical protein
MLIILLSIAVLLSFDFGLCTETEAQHNTGFRLPEHWRKSQKAVERRAHLRMNVKSQNERGRIGPNTFADRDDDDEQNRKPGESGLRDDDDDDDDDDDKTMSDIKLPAIKRINLKSDKNTSETLQNAGRASGAAEDNGDTDDDNSTAAIPPRIVLSKKAATARKRRTEQVRRTAGRPLPGGLRESRAKVRHVS